MFDHIFGDFFYASLPCTIMYGTQRGFIMTMDSGDKYRVMLNMMIPPPDPYLSENDKFSQIAVF